jgi:hypothetical protein
MITGSDSKMNAVLQFNSFLNALDAMHCDNIKDNHIPGEEPVFW